MPFPWAAVLGTIAALASATPAVISLFQKPARPSKTSIRPDPKLAKTTSIQLKRRADDPLTVSFPEQLGEQDTARSRLIGR